MRRRVHVALALAVLLVMSGCTLPGADLTASASPVSVEDSALDATGYAMDENATIAFNETIGIGGENHEIGVKSYIASYEHTAHDGRLVVFSSPSPNEGAPVNPFANLSERRDIARMLGEVFNTTPLTVENRRTVTMVGQQTEVVTYTTTNQSAGNLTPVVVHVAMTQHEGDAVVAVSVHPQSVGENGTFARLVKNLEHGESDE
jgi:hypothetical protein